MPPEIDPGEKTPRSSLFNLQQSLQLPVMDRQDLPRVTVWSTTLMPSGVSKISNLWQSYLTFIQIID